MLIILFLAESLPSFRKIGEKLFSLLTKNQPLTFHKMLNFITFNFFSNHNVFSGILQLISSIFVTCLTFVFPPLFYMRLIDMDKSKDGEAK